MPIYPTDYTEEDYESDMAELRKEDKMKEEQATDERTLEDLLLHLQKAETQLNSAIWLFSIRRDTEAFSLLKDNVHEKVTKAYNTAAYLSELSATQGVRMTTHRHLAHHNNKGTYLFDGCDRCEEHSKTLYDLDDGTLQWLAEMADLAHSLTPSHIHQANDLSMNERRAITKLRLYARITFRSQITEEAAS